MNGPDAFTQIVIMFVAAMLIVPMLITAALAFFVHSYFRRKDQQAYEQHLRDVSKSRREELSS